MKTFSKILIKTKKSKKAAIEAETLIKWIIAVLILGLLIYGAILLKAKGINLFEKLSEFLRFGR